MVVQVPTNFLSNPVSLTLATPGFLFEEYLILYSEGETTLPFTTKETLGVIAFPFDLKTLEDKAMVPFFIHVYLILSLLGVEIFPSIKLNTTSLSVVL